MKMAPLFVLKTHLVKTVLFFCNTTGNFVCNEKGEQGCMNYHYGPYCTKFCNETGNFTCNANRESVCIENHYVMCISCLVYCDASIYERVTLHVMRPVIQCALMDIITLLPCNCAECNNICIASIYISKKVTSDACNQDGDLVCTEGYHDPSTNCNECAPKSGCCNIKQQQLYIVGYAWSPWFTVTIFLYI